MHPDPEKVHRAKAVRDWDCWDETILGKIEEFRISLPTLQIQALRAGDGVKACLLNLCMNMNIFT